MPIINPWLIYLIDLVDGLSILLFFMGVIMGGVGLFVYLMQVTEEEMLESFPAKSILICSLVVSIITTLLPSSKTLTKMVIAQNITVERVDVAKEVIEKVYGDILNVMEERQ